MKVSCEIDKLSFKFKRDLDLVLDGGDAVAVSPKDIPVLLSAGLPTTRMDHRRQVARSSSGKGFGKVQGNQPRSRRSSSSEELGSSWELAPFCQQRLRRVAASNSRARVLLTVAPAS